MRRNEIEECVKAFFIGFGIGLVLPAVAPVVQGLIRSGVVRQVLPALASGLLQSQSPRRALNPRRKKGGYIDPNSLACPQCGGYNNIFADYNGGWRFFQCGSCGTGFKIHMDQARELGLVRDQDEVFYDEDIR